ncbi:MAG TPA: NrfD/PsrC family molybdoenzyme membrane anchor subunit [Lutibacter sp.]
MIESRKRELVKEFAPRLETTSKLSKIWIGGLIAVILVGVYAFFIQLFNGHEVTGMRDNVVWGIFIVNFIFFVCLSYSGAFFSGILHFVDTPWKNAVSRIVEMITVISLIIGPIFILLCIGRLDRLHYLFLYPRIQSPITWDIMAIMIDLVACFLYLYLTFIPDFAILRDHSEALNVPNWKKKMYKFFAIGYQDTKTQRKRLNKITKAMSAIVIVLAIVAYSVLAWIFSLTLQPGWNSTIFAPYFIIAGLFSGVAVIIITMYLVRKFLKLEKYIRKTHFKVGGFILLILALLYGYFTFTEYFSKWFSHKATDSSILNTLFTRYFWEFILANYIGVLVPVVILFYKKFRTIKLITFASVVAILGIWLNRYLIVIPTLETPFIPIQDTRLEYIHYSATWVEWAMSSAGIAGFLLLFTLISKIVPLIPMNSIIDSEYAPKIKKRVNKETKEITD